ncbi:guanylate cyclase 32E-like isoform X2 [Oratosquilla oratoria]|uniref:guanylate cyclase 32E-like isoform X2 n=1 Tax=Oratosquilla oratoria TaxID=337810 RepID=UPI003F75821D
MFLPKKIVLVLTLLSIPVTSHAAMVAAEVAEEEEEVMRQGSADHEDSGWHQHFEASAKNDSAVLSPTLRGFQVQRRSRSAPSSPGISSPPSSSSSSSFSSPFPQRDRREPSSDALPYLPPLPEEEGECRAPQEPTNNSEDELQRWILHDFLMGNFDKEKENISIGFLSSFSSNKLALGALPLAVEVVNNSTHLLPGRRLVFEAADVGNSRVEALAALSIRRMTAMLEKGVLAFIGPDDHCNNEALVAAAWNLPMITYKCADKRVSNKTKYYTFARTIPPSTKIVKGLVSLLHHYRWRQFVLITEQSSEYLLIAEAVKSFADHHGVKVTRQFHVHNYTSLMSHVVKNIVRESIAITRIYVLIAAIEVQWDFLLHLRTEAKSAMAEYAVICIDDDNYSEHNQSRGFRLPVVPDDEHDLSLSLSKNKTMDVFYTAFRNVLKITPAYPNSTAYRQFEQNVLLQMSKHPFCVPVFEPFLKYIEVPLTAAHLYDAVLLYATVLNETLAANEDPRNGTLILNRIKNKSFESIQGFTVHMDENGDAEGSYSLMAIRKISGGGPVPLRWHKVGFFEFEAAYPEGNDMDIVPKLHLTDEVMWLSGSAPRDEPPCGFEGCQPDWKSYVIGLVVSLIFVVAALFLFRHYRYEHKLACLLWKIEMKDVRTINMTLMPGQTFANEAKRTVQSCRQSLFGVPNCSSGGVAGGEGGQPETPRYAYCRIGIYKGNVVALKPIKKRTVDITRNIRKELKMMRDVRHENLLPFIGASVDTGAICILTAYSARGSLEDVLHNDDLQLDNMFVASLVADLIKGMNYLHESEIGVHGSLRSTNCLIDSRWVLQVADFGLHEFKAGQEVTAEDRKLLWVSPEQLREATAQPRGTQKGDVFSFAIILYEVIGRAGPWGNLMGRYTVEEIVSKVEKGTEPPLRPPLDLLKAPDYVHRCLRECWAEEPEERPDFKFIRVRLKEMHAGLALNIVDNMLAMMEKYAYTLEGKVQERTHQLMEEKKKTEALLLRMLPKSVAESLKRGEQVSPETYDNVTIYFSDIVGFTSLSAESTPMQIVNMLNELYTRFDAIIGDYDVYKVETIGDAYMVVSGLPLVNGDQHAAQIASMALKLLNAVKNFRIRHRPGDTLKLRIGIHSGPCVAGVVGLTMPRYCLFGDTVNTASRMESTGEPLRIHVSDANKRMLDRLGGYVVRERGLTYIKGKGKMMTWWLEGESVPGQGQTALQPQKEALSWPYGTNGGGENGVNPSLASLAIGGGFGGTTKTARVDDRSDGCGNKTGVASDAVDGDEVRVGVRAAKCDDQEPHSPCRTTASDVTRKADPQETDSSPTSETTKYNKEDSANNPRDACGGSKTHDETHNSNSHNDVVKSNSHGSSNNPRTRPQTAPPPLRPPRPHCLRIDTQCNPNQGQSHTPSPRESVRLNSDSTQDTHRSPSSPAGLRSPAETQSNLEARKWDLGGR